MEPTKFYIPIPTPTLTYAARVLSESGHRAVDQAEQADYLLYPSPTPLAALADYSHGATVVGGNLDFLNSCVHCLDLLKDPFYLCENAAITAESALGLMLSRMPCAIQDAPILVLGWGRIGKCLTHQLHHLNAPVTVFARKPEDRALLRSLGYHPITLEDLPAALPQFRCVVNTIPAEVLTPLDVRALSPDCFLLDLASVRSIPGDHVLHARGLPGKYKPESAGALIARTILHHLGGTS